MRNDTEAVIVKFEPKTFAEHKTKQMIVKDDGFNVIKHMKIDLFFGETIGKISSSRFFVNKKANISDLAFDLDRHKDIQSVGVVNDRNEVIGIIVRKELFDLLGKPYGRDLFKYRTVDRVMRNAPVFGHERNVFSVTEEVSDYIQKHDIEYFLLSTEEKVFAGIFTTRDLMVYLSQITQNDINLARNIQKSLVQDEHYFDEMKFRAVGASVMAKGVGGDFYDIKKISGHKWLLSVCDVSGKGISASLLTTSISGMYHMYDFSKGTEKFVGMMNDYIHNSFEMEKFVTGIFVELDENTGEITLYDMGHSYLFIQKSNKLYKLKTAHENIPLGVKPGIIPVPDYYQLNKGDVLFLVTDGILEQKNSQGIEYGERRLSQIIRTNKNIRDMKNCIFTDLKKFRGSQTQLDDMTILILNYGG